MTKTQKYLEALKIIETWTTVSEWAVEVAKLYPEILDDSNKQT